MNIDIDALRQIEREKGIDFPTVIEAFETAMASAYKRSRSATGDEARVTIDRISGEVTVFAQELDDEGQIISEWREDIDVREMGRIVAQTAKQVFTQRLREAEREATFGEYVGREGDIVSGTVSQQGHVTLIEIGRNTEALLPGPEQVPNERLEHGQHTRALVIEVRRQHRGAQIVCSRTHPGLVAAMFALEVPEIEGGRGRDQGHRARGRLPFEGRGHEPRQQRRPGRRVRRSGRLTRQGRAARAARGRARAHRHHPLARRAGAARGQRAVAVEGQRGVYLYPDDGTAMVVVPDYQLSLAIGREGQNARLAAKLTGWRIDIKSEGQFAAEQEAFQQAFEAGLIDEFGNPLSEEGETAIQNALATAQSKRDESLEQGAEDVDESPADE